MKFSYKDYGGEILRPVIPITIISKNHFMIYEALVDSGADSNILPAELAEILGLDLTKGEKGQVSGITGKNQDIYFHYVNMRVGGELYKNIRIGFLKEMGEYSYGVVGQRGFFDIFVVKFDLVKEEISLMPRANSISTSN